MSIRMIRPDTRRAGAWGTLLSPKRKYDVGAGGRLFLEAVFFLAATVILYNVGLHVWAPAIVVVAVADRIALVLIP